MKKTALLFLILTAIRSTLAAQTEETGFGRHKQMYAVPAPGPVIIDGKLDDWDLSGSIDLYVMAATKDMQGALRRDV